MNGQHRDEIDRRYQDTCAQIGQSYLKRLDLVNQLKSLDAELAHLREAAHQHLATYRMACEPVEVRRD